LIFQEATKLEAIAQQVRDYWKLGAGPIKDFRYTLEANGIVVTCADPKADKIDAFSQRTLINGEEVYLIVISKNNQSLARARFDMAHELAHILLHPWSEDLESIPKEEFKARERQANIFASALLLPKDTFGFDVAHYPSNLEYYLHLKSKWNVSIQTMIYRTQQLGIITTSQYQYLMRQISKNGWREKEPGDQPYIMTSNLLQGAVELLLKENELSVDGFLNALKEKGVVLHSEEIEELLCLKKGTLERKVKAKPSLIQLKSQIE
jgi:Zn-dependent peptidase ImmA (M78 family)